MTVYLEDADFTLINADVLEGLASLPDESVHCVVTSPPYYALRDYGANGQIGLEPSVGEYVARLVSVFREVRRVLRSDGTLWLNLGDSYAGSWGAQGRDGEMSGRSVVSARQIENHPRRNRTGSLDRYDGAKAKDLLGVPWRVAFALQADGWYLRSDIIWSKPNPMPESVTDRPTKAHEYVFLLTRSARYFYNADAIAEPARWIGPNGMPRKGPHAGQMRGRAGKNGTIDGPLTRNARSVWTVQTQPFADAHFAVMPEYLALRCILAGCPEGGTVLDPFLGSGTTAYVARKHGRRSIGIELSSEYCALAARRLAQQSLFAQVSA